MGEQSKKAMTGRRGVDEIHFRNPGLPTLRFRAIRSELLPGQWLVAA